MDCFFLDFTFQAEHNNIITNNLQCIFVIEYIFHEKTLHTKSCFTRGNKIFTQKKTPDVSLLKNKKEYLLFDK